MFKQPLQLSLNPFSVGTEFIRQDLTSTSDRNYTSEYDVWYGPQAERIKTFIMTVDLRPNRDIYDSFKLKKNLCFPYFIKKYFSAARVSLSVKQIKNDHSRV